MASVKQRREYDSSRRREQARATHGWIMDVYLLRRRTG